MMAIVNPAITPVFSLIWSFKNHSKILVWCLRHIWTKIQDPKHAGSNEMDKVSPVSQSMWMRPFYKCSSSIKAQLFEVGFSHVSNYTHYSLCFSFKWGYLFNCQWWKCIWSNVNGLMPPVNPFNISGQVFVYWSLALTYRVPAK